MSKKSLSRDFLLVSVCVILLASCAPLIDADDEDTGNVGIGSGPGSLGVGGYIVDKLAGGALNYIAGKTLGYALAQAGLGNVFGGQVDYSAALDEIQTTLNAITKKLELLSADIANMSSALSAEIANASYNTRADLLGPLISRIETTKLDLIRLAKIPIPSRDDFASGQLYNKALLKWQTDQTQEKDRISGVISDMIADRNQFHNVLMGSAGQESLLKTWSQVITAKHRFLTEDDYAYITKMFNYFDMMQATMTMLIVEYYNAEEMDPTYVDDIVEEYWDNIAEQKSLVQVCVPAGVFVDTQTGRMWMRRPVTRTHYFDDAHTNGVTYSNIMDMNFSIGVWDYMTGENHSGSEYYNGDAPTLNEDAAKNFGFDNWELPFPADLAGLLNGYTGSNATTEWFVPKGAFLDDPDIFDWTWSTSNGVVWTHNWYWNGSLSKEIDTVVNLGLAGTTNESYVNGSAFSVGSHCFGAIFPYRTIDATTEKYYWQ
jgi:hypothetical protein